MATQRIVLTSPWKLGLFVFVLVAGCGFGLIYAYLQFFGGTLQLEDERTLRAFYGVTGGVALLGLLGYLAVISSARPLDRVVRGGKKREKLLKQVEGVQDPADVDMDEFEDEPALALLLERWASDRSEVHDAKVMVVQQKEVLNTLISRVREAGEAGQELVGGEVTPDLARLIDAINFYANERGTGNSSSPASSDLESLRAPVTSIEGLPQDLDGFCDTLAEAAVGIVNLGGSSPDASVGQGLAKSRVELEKLAEEANKMALQTALQISRLGDASPELLELAEQIRGLSTRFQTQGFELRKLEEALVKGPAGREDALEPREWAEQLGFGVEALGECADRLREALAPMRDALGMGPLAEVSAADRRPMGDFGSLTTPAESEPSQAANPEVAEEERIYELAEFGAVELPAQAAASGKSAPVVRDLSDFGAVEI